MAVCWKSCGGLGGNARFTKVSRGVSPPSLITNWALWIPCSFIVHLFPTDLQIQLTGFANAFYSLLLIWIGRQSGVQRSRHSVGVTPVSRLK